MVELKVLNLHWLENTKAERDLCVHSSVYLRICDKIVSNEISGDWTVSSSAYFFLKSLKLTHDENSPSQLLPCCGFTMYALGDNYDELLIMGCSSGINWTITHEQNQIIHQFEDGKVVKTSFDEWRSAVCNFSDEVMEFYESSSPKIVDDEEDRRGFELFMREWKLLRAEAFD